MKQQSIKQPITKKQLEILLLLYQFRFLDTNTIQLLLHHKLPTRIQAWLQDLTKREYILQFYDRTTLIGRTKPAVYCLTTKVRKILKGRKDCEVYVLNQIYREKERSEEFRAHCCYVGSLYIMFRDMYNGKDGQGAISFFTKVELIGYDHFPKPFPDAYFAIKRKGKKTIRYFLEVFDLNIQNKAIQWRIRRYIKSEEGDWKEETNNTKFPTILLITINIYKQRSMKKLIQKVRDQEFSNLPFYITNKDIVKDMPTEDIWEKVE